jgi:hypothetical protein
LNIEYFLPAFVPCGINLPTVTDLTCTNTKNRKDEKKTGMVASIELGFKINIRDVKITVNSG